ncbi:MAG: hypothetical protein HYY06_05445 [Deltaproteobacteria bacterium]|nr:hypothetical protein [Deltaproteobacteria bacterium]
MAIVLLVIACAALGCAASHAPPAPDGGADSGIDSGVDAAEDGGDDGSDSGGPVVPPEHVDLVLELYAEECRHSLRCESKWEFSVLAELLYCTPEIAERVIGLVEALRTGTIEIDPDRMRDCLDQLAAADCAQPHAVSPSCAEAIQGLVPRGGGCVRTAECQADDRCVLELQCPGSCVPRAGEGETCISSLTCRAELRCGAGQCILPRAEGEDCDQDHDCDSGLYCHHRGDRDRPGNCEPLREEGDSCWPAPSTKQMECAGDLVCAGPLREEPACAEGGAVGEACSREFPCAAFGRCSEGRCVRLSGPGEPCEENGNCPSFQGCYDGMCRVGPLQGEACEQKESPCVEGLCVEGLCEVVPDGGECHWDGGLDETFGPCAGFCDTEPVRWVCAALRAEGEPCVESRQCAEGLECRGGACLPVCRIE